MSQGECRVPFEGVTEEIQGLLDGFGIRPGQEIKPLQVEVVGFRVGGGSLTQGVLFPGQERDLQVLHDGQRNFVLDVEDVALLPVEPLRPDMEAGPGVDELGSDAQAVPGLPDAPLEDSPDVEHLSDLADVELHAFEGERRCPGHDANPLDAGRAASRC